MRLPHHAFLRRHPGRERVLGASGAEVPRRPGALALRPGLGTVPEPGARMKIGVFTLVYREVSFPTFCGMVGLASLARGPLRPEDPDFPAMGVTFEYFFRRGFSATHN